MKGKLHIYTDGYEYFVASSPNDALRAWSELTGENGRYHETDFYRLSDDERFTICWYRDEEPTQGWPPIEGVLIEDGRIEFTMTNAEWVKWKGRGFLASPEG